MPPAIEDIREIDGAVWVRVEITGEAGSLTIWTEDEKAVVIRAAVEKEREACARIANDYGDGEAGYDSMAISAAYAIEHDIRKRGQ